MTLPRPTIDYVKLETRRQFFGKLAYGLGGVALATLGNFGTAKAAGISGGRGALGSPHFPAKAKRVIYLFMAGAPSQMDLFDYKPYMRIWHDKHLPEEIRRGQRLTTMTSEQERLPIASSTYEFKQHGESGTWVSELLPYTARMVDDLALIYSTWTEAINHDPAITYIQTGAQIPGRPSLGAWLSYGLGSDNENLPAFVVLNSSWTGKIDAQGLYSRLWGSGFLPTEHQGVAFQSRAIPSCIFATRRASKPGQDGPCSTDWRK